MSESIFDFIFSKNKYETILEPKQEVEFQRWKNVLAPNDSGEDYDFRGAFKAGITPSDNGHWPDTFKKPNHPTFSRESIYAKDEAYKLAGEWNGNDFLSPNILKP